MFHRLTSVRVPGLAVVWKVSVIVAPSPDTSILSRAGVGPAYRCDHPPLRHALCHWGGLGH